jgi:radical SAM superfamily enzyme YgiQ (UPF0313 family)
MKDKFMNAFICYCPGADPVLPHAALAVLGSQLKKDGLCRYHLRDLNLEAFLYFLSEKQLTYAIKKVSYRVENNGFKSAELKREARQLLEKAGGLPGRIEQSAADFRNPGKFYDAKTFLELREDFNNACRLISLQYDRVRFQKYSVFPHTYDSYAEIRLALDDPDASMLLDFYRAAVIPGIRTRQPGIVGISVSYFSQLIPSFLLAETIRGVSPDTHIVLGGPVVTWGKEVLVRESDKFSALIDSFCVGEGERCISTLVKVLKNNTEPDEVPNLVYYEKGAAVVNPRDDDISMETTITPDYKSMPLERYLAPERIISLCLTRGCYFNRCKFCNYAFTRLSPYRECPPRSAVRTIAAIVEDTGEQVFCFESDVVHARYLYEFSRALLEAEVKIKWHTCMRFESNLSPELFDIMAKAGCVRIYLGLESANQRVLNEMQKGIKLEAVRRVLEYCHKADISLEVGVFIGYPGETPEEGRDTLEFIRENRSKIKRVDPAVYRMLKGSAVEDELDRYHITLEKNRDAYWYTMEFHNPIMEAEKEKFTGVLKGIQGMYPVLAAVDIPEEILYTARKGVNIAEEIGEAFVKKTREPMVGVKSRYIYY